MNYNCDKKWFELMHDRSFVKHLSDTIINETPNPQDFKISIFSPNFTIVPNICNIYVVPSTLSSPSVCFILDLRYNKLICYDPTDELSDVDHSLPLFDKHRKSHIVNTILGRLRGDLPEIVDLRTISRAQQLKNDIFSQSWVFMFISAYINDVFNGFAILNFVRWQTNPLKLWINCIISKLPPSLYSQTYAKHKDFLTRCRRFSCKHGRMLESLPSIVKIGGKSRVSCIYSIIIHYAKI